MQQEFEAFERKENVDQMMMAKDVSNAVDFLKSQTRVRGIAVVGESMGGRNAIIGAALDERIRGAIAISSGGYSVVFAEPETEKFIAYINPNSYVWKISPRRFMMIHSVNDSVIPIEEANFTFSLAKEPKNFVLLQTCNHGYCDAMEPFLLDELMQIFRKEL